LIERLSRRDLFRILLRHALSFCFHRIHLSNFFEQAITLPSQQRDHIRRLVGVFIASSYFETVRFSPSIKPGSTLASNSCREKQARTPHPPRH
jgi:hypothetical protein